jgi:hypothetical protein
VITATDLIGEAVSTIDPTASGDTWSAIASRVERVLDLALINTSINNAMNPAVSAFVTKWFNVTTDSNGEVDLTASTLLSDKALIPIFPFIKVRAEVPEGELYPIPDLETMNNLDNEESLYFYTVEALTLYTKGGSDMTPLEDDSDVRILAPYVLSLTDANPLLRPLIVSEILKLLLPKKVK